MIGKTMKTTKKDYDNLFLEVETFEWTIAHHSKQKKQIKIKLLNRVWHSSMFDNDIHVT